ncbi:MAG: hypothetical protein VKJ24_18700 [Synechococcales bacterium]|nr:hypothetical protein [Synechococcales bacterium]
MTALCLHPVMGVAAPASGQPDSQGDYYSNEGSQQGSVPNGSRLFPGSLWQVRAAQLNCRREAGLQAPIVRQFKRGDRLQADVGRGGSDEVLVNALGSDRRPWMRVRSATGQVYNCYVRANQKYIQPIVPAQPKG